jgi:predicted DNA-binding transcriptional regulator AlpA
MATLEPENTRIQRLENLFNELDVARITGLSVASVRRWRLLRQGPKHLKTGAAVRCRPDDVTAWLESCPSRGRHDMVGQILRRSTPHVRSALSRRVRGFPTVPAILLGRRKILRRSWIPGSTAHFGVAHPSHEDSV